MHKPHANTEEIETLKQQETALRAAVERERAGSVQLNNRLQQIGLRFFVLHLFIEL